MSPEQLSYAGSDSSSKQNSSRGKWDHCRLSLMTLDSALGLLFDERVQHFSCLCHSQSQKRNGSICVFLLPDLVLRCSSTNVRPVEQRSYSFPPDYVFLLSLITLRKQTGPAHFRIHHKLFTHHYFCLDHICLMKRLPAWWLLHYLAHLHA